MKSVKKFETFEELKAGETKKLPAAKVAKNHKAFSRMIAELLLAKKVRYR